VIGKLLKSILNLAFLISAGFIVVFGGARLYTSLYAVNKTHDVETVPVKKAVIVYGAGLLRDGSPTPVLRDRVATAARLYFEGKADKLLMSGDNRFINYNEPGAMQAYAVSLGVPEDDIVMDFAGRRTYDTCYRARHIFGLEEAILVTQKFHLPRALYTCNNLGVEAVGVSADLRVYSRGPYLYWNLREVGATLNAIWEVHFARPLPLLGEYEPIFPTEG
jgi:SanA protein